MEPQDIDNSVADADAAYQKATTQFGALLPAEILSLWKQALPNYRDQIATFLKEKERLLLTDVFGMEDDPILLDQIEPWSVTDMNLYYEARSDTPEIHEILRERRILTVKQLSFTMFDDHQLIRDQDRPNSVAQKNHIQTRLTHLDLIYESYALLDPEQNAEIAIVLTYIQILDVLRKRLKTEETQLSGPSKHTIVCQMDAINENIAMIFYNMIDNFKLDEMQEPLESIFDKLNALDQEIFPWLATHFMPSLPLEEAEGKKLIAEFLKLHAFRHKETIYDLYDNLTGASNKVSQTSTMLLERKSWQSFKTQPMHAKLQYIANYTLRSQLTDWTTLNILMDVMENCPSHGLELDFVNTVYKFINRIKTDKHYLLQSFAYLEHIKRDIDRNSSQLVSTAPGICIAIMADEINAAKFTAQSLENYPPCAELFYMQDNESLGLDEEKPIDLQPKIIKILQELDKETRREYMAEIFANHAFEAQHAEFILSDTAKGLDLVARDFPLLSLRLYYSGHPLTLSLTETLDEVSLWESFLDEDLIVNTDFFKFSSNLQLFSQLNSISAALLDREKISQHPLRYKQLVRALEIYQTLYAKVFTLIQSSIHYSSQTRWAKELSDMIISHIAFPENSDQMDFNNIVKFLDISLNQPKAIAPDKLIQQMQQDLFERLAQSFPQNLAQDNILIFKFMQLYISSAPAFTPAQSHKLTAYPLNELPTICVSWLDLGFLEKLPFLAVFESCIRQFKFMTGIEEQIGRVINKSLVRQIGRAIIETAAARFNIPHNDAQMRSLHQIVAPYAQDIRPQISFVMQFYFAFCQLQKNLNPNDYDKKFLNYFKKPSKSIYEANQLKAFIKIYSALRAAQSSIFKTDWIAAQGLNNLPVKQALKLIQKHAKKSGSRSQKAWELVLKYDTDASAENIPLIKDIHAYGFANSGIFKRSTLLGTNFFRTTSLAVAMVDVDDENLLDKIENNSQSRLAKTVRALR